MFGGGIQMDASGSTTNLERFLKTAGKTPTIRQKVDAVAQAGIQSLIAATPRDTGRTAESWSYKIIEAGDGLSIEFHNSNMNQGRNIAVLIRYGHGTRNGGYVPANDYITPALRPIFERVSNEAWKAVTSA